MYKVYIASHFFNRGGILSTEELVQALEKEFSDKLTFYVPHRQASINDKTNRFITDVDIYRTDMQQLMTCDILIANLDGVEIDAGVSGEIMAVALNNELTSPAYKYIIGYTTDSRYIGITQEELSKYPTTLDKNQFGHLLDNSYYVNRMITGAIQEHGKLIRGTNSDNSYIDTIITELYRLLGTQK